MACEELRRVSRSLYTMVDRIIGEEVIIDIRRTTTNLADDIINERSEIVDAEFECCYSGSKAEGLRFKSSDDDWMLIMRHIKVIPTESYTAIYDSNTTLLLMENEMTKPGFALLRLIGGATNQRVSRSTEYMFNGHYLSCQRWRDMYTALGTVSDKEFTHGPCASATFGPYEYDFAYCLRCDIWPNNAHDCIRRLNQSAWPSHDTILSIVSDGVLFVPIGAKQSSFENTEWRMSFSLAEKKLIHAMNHIQFLCYGLLKIFLKEAIDVNPEVKGLLCSYFLKTALFWEIATTSNQWNVSSMMSCFWNCFRRLLQWVSWSYCPNFFVPQNNMFEGKIESTNRNKLQQHLRTLYCEGYRSLLRCQSLSPYMLPIMQRSDLVLVKTELNHSSIACNIIGECFLCIDLFPYDTTCNNLIAHQLACVTDTHKRFILKTLFNRTLTKFCMTESYHRSVGDRSNRSRYKTLTERMNMVERFRIDSVSHFLHNAMLCYNHGRYNKALRLIHQSKEKIASPGFISLCKLNYKLYAEAWGDDFPIETMLRRHVSDSISIKNDQCIPDLYIESHGSKYIQSHFSVGRYVQFSIPPLVCAYFLQYLCHRRLGCLGEATEASYELSLFLQHADGQPICTCDRGPSWQMLGICQQTSGNDEAAYHSYRRALQQDDNFYPKTTCIRLATLLTKYF